MTSLEKRKTRLVFLTSDLVRDRGRLRQVVIEAETHYCRVRLAGMRTSFPISYAAIYHAAARLRAEQERADRLARRKGHK